MSAGGTTLLDPPAPARPNLGGGARDGHRGGDDGGRGRGDGNDGGGNSLPLSNERLLMVFVLVASTMFFTGLIGAFIVLRFASTGWPPPGSPPLPLGLTINTGVLLASSVTLALAHLGRRRGHAVATRAGLLLTMALGATFLVLQAICWRDFLAAGFTAASNTYGGSFYLLTAAHFAHAIAGLLLLAIAAGRAFRLGLGPSTATSLDLAAMFWHFVDLAWVVIFLLLRA